MDTVFLQLVFSENTYFLCLCLCEASRCDFGVFFKTNLILKSKGGLRVKSSSVDWKLKLFIALKCRVSSGVFYLLCFVFFLLVICHRICKVDTWEHTMNSCLWSPEPYKKAQWFLGFFKICCLSRQAPDKVQSKQGKQRKSRRDG